MQMELFALFMMLLMVLGRNKSKGGPLEGLFAN